MKSINRMLVGAALLTLTLVAPGVAQAQEPALTAAQELELRVLLVATGDRAADPGRALMEDLMDTLGVPYEVLDCSKDELTPAVLMDGDRGRFNGIILTQANTYVDGLPYGLDVNEFTLLHEYERLNNVAESVLAGWPWAPGVNYGVEINRSFWWIDGVTTTVTGQWTGDAGGSLRFEYVNEAQPLDSKEAGHTHRAAWNDGTGPEVHPLLVDAENPDSSLISELRYPDGRRVLLSTMDNASHAIHSQVLAYEFLNYATSGLFIGARRVYLSTHTDDLFLPDELWNPATDKNYPEYCLETDPSCVAKTIRMDDVDVANAVAQHKAFQTAHPLAAGLRFEFSFNGIGADSIIAEGGKDPLLTAMTDNRQNFRFINHTYQAFQMDRMCPDPDEVAAPTISQCPVTGYEIAYDEIDMNRQFWQQHNFLQYLPNFKVLLTDSHSGLTDRLNYPESSDQSLHVPFSEGANPWFLTAAQDLGVTVLASDASRTNQGEIRRIGFVEKTRVNEDGTEETLSGDFSNIAILPRYPTAIYYNTHTPVENTDEYYYIHHERYVEQGLDPCTIPGAICFVPRDAEGNIDYQRGYQQILAAEADTTFRHMLSYKPFPHYFHQGNLINYERTGSQATAAAPTSGKGKKPAPPAQLGRTLQTDWLHSVMNKYESMLKLPIENLEFNQLAAVVWQTIAQQEALVEGTVRKTVDIDGNEVRTVSLQANGNAGQVFVTGVRNAVNEAQYGGQWQSLVPVSPTAPVELQVDAGEAFGVSP